MSTLNNKFRTIKQICADEKAALIVVLNDILAAHDANNIDVYLPVGDFNDSRYRLKYTARLNEANPSQAAAERRTNNEG